MMLRKFLLRWLAVVILALALVPGTAGSAPTGIEVAEPFRAYYNAHQGMRVLGSPLTGLITVDGYPAQYFEKGRIEDHRAEIHDPTWAFMYGRLTPELMEWQPQGTVTGAAITYGQLKQAAATSTRVLPPPGFHSGTMPVDGGKAIFIPIDPWLRPAPGYTVPSYFWAYMNRADLFPGGWLHDIGLPLTGLVGTTTVKNGNTREIVLQAFERTVLTYDPQNPDNWQVERGNIGTDSQSTPPAPARIELPAANQQVVLPLHILARGGQPGEQVTAMLTWQDGTRLTQVFTLLREADSQGLLIGNLDWVNRLHAPQPRTQSATLELRRVDQTVLARQKVTVLSPNDQNTQEIKVYWTVSGAEEVQPQVRRVIRTARIGTAALEELLWGPPTISQVGFRTALPTPAEVLAYPGRGADWGPRVTLRSLNIVNGVATADFSPELRAYGGGSLRVKLIRDQITRTLTQFPTVQQVRIAIAGQTIDGLEP
jgi:hypothetical protein